MPVAPENLTAVAGETTVTLSWTVVADATSYRVYRNGSETPIETDAPITVLTYTDTDLTTGTEYRYTVRAVKGDLESGNSNEVTATPLAVPTGLTATVSATGDTVTVMLSWTEVTGATSYNIYRNGDTTPLVTNPETITGTTYTDTDIVRGTAYSYTVRALKGSLQSGDSDPPATANPPTLPPGNLMATSGDKQVELRWESVERAITYSVYRNDLGATTPVPIETGIDGLTHTDTGLTNSILYTYTVRSVGSNGVESGDSNSMDVRPFPPPLPAPGNIMATPGDGQVELTWTAVAGAGLYFIYRNGEFISDTFGLTYTDRRATNGIEYLYVVQAGPTGDPIEIRATPQR